MVLLVCLLLLAGIILYKVRRVHLQGFQTQAQLANLRGDLSRLTELETELAHLYAQLQSYHDLVSLIHPARPLPLLRGWAASPDFLLEICKHSLYHKPRIILECSSGATTLALARCCEINGMGHVYSLEHDACYAEQTRQRLHEQGLDAWATIIDAPLVNQPKVKGQPWYSLDGLCIPPGECALLVVDGPPWNTAPLARYPALPLLAEYLATSCTVFLDDANRPDEQEMARRWAIEFPGMQLTWPMCEKGCAKLVRQSTR